MFAYTDAAGHASFAAARKVVDMFDSSRGSIDARNPSRIVVEFDAARAGCPSMIAESACRSFRDVGLIPLTMNVTDRTAHFTLRDVAA